MLMGRDQMAVLHSFFSKELCRILQLHLAIQKDTSLLHFLLKCRYFLRLKTRVKEGGVFGKLIPMVFPWVSFCFKLPSREGKDKGMEGGRLGRSHFPVLSPFVWSAKQTISHGRAAQEPQQPHTVTGVSPLECHIWGVTSGVSPLGARGSQRDNHDCHETPVKHRQVHQGGTKKWKNDCRKPQKKYNLLFNMSQALPWGRDVTRACEVSGSGSTEQVGNGTFTVQMAESAAFLPLLVYTQEQNAGKYLILVLLSRRFFTEDTPGPARQSVQTRLHQRVTQVQPASAQGITFTFPLPEGSHKHLREVTAACFAFCPPPISPAQCQWSNPANASNLLLEH